MSDMHDASADIERIVTALVDRARRTEPLGAHAIILLVRQYRLGRDGVDEVLGDALARALDRQDGDRSTLEQARWLDAFAEATTVSDDPRLVEAARAAIDALSAAWGSLSVVDEAAASIEACLAAAAVADQRSLLPSAVDALERVVAETYRPGDGVAHRMGGERVRGGLSDHVRLASALLTAFEVTGRLPYSMLAEELMQTSRPELLRPADFEIACESARALIRLARLHDDPGYRGAAVIAHDADYRAEARRLLAAAADQLCEPGADEAVYALALSELGNTRVDG